MRQVVVAVLTLLIQLVHANFAKHHHHSQFLSGSGAPEAVAVASPEGVDVSDDNNDEDEPEDQGEQAEPTAPPTKLESMEAELKQMQHLQADLENKMNYLENEHYDVKIQQEATPVKRETVPALAQMLAAMRTEMHEYASPFYQQHLDERLSDLDKAQDDLEAKIKELKTGLKFDSTSTALKPTMAENRTDDSWSLGSKLLFATMVAALVFGMVWMYLTNQKKKNSDDAGTN